MPEVLTPRLRLRSWREDDWAPMAEINRDPLVTRYLNRPVDDQAVAGFGQAVIAHLAEHGLGLWAVEPLDGPLAGRLIGFAGIGYPTFLPDVADRPELGWRLASWAWGHGYGTEAALAARDHALEHLDRTAIISIIHPENAASQGVATKLGMHIAFEIHNPVIDRVVDVWELGAA